MRNIFFNWLGEKPPTKQSTVSTPSFKVDAVEFMDGEAGNFPMGGDDRDPPSVFPLKFGAIFGVVARLTKGMSSSMHVGSFFLAGML